MTRIHDMGGRFGDGPVQPEGEDEPIFHEEWHRRALAVTLATGSLGQWNLDMSRHARESLVLTRADLAGEDIPADGAAHPLAGRALTKDKVAGVLSRGGPTTRESNVAPLFEPGQAVRALRPAANRLVDGGHTRMPSYVAGARGRILMAHGAHVLPDSNAHGLGEAPEPLYAVIFPAGELWAAPENPDDEVVLDLWQSYLEPA